MEGRVSLEGLEGRFDPQWMEGREECSSFQSGRGGVCVSGVGAPHRRVREGLQRTFLSPGGRGGAAPPLSFFKPGPGDDARFGAMAAEGSR